MDVLTTPADMRAWSMARRTTGTRVGFVPTMGALHAGHLSLVDIAAARTHHVVVSIFVNPLQFDRRADFDAYPRPIDDDVARCADVGVEAVYAPTAGAMYPDGFQTHVEPGGLADVMEGAARPGHFRGVTTVVSKLFGAVAPDVAVFGEKDFQQLAVLRRMTCDLDLGVEIVGAPIVREPDGLAMSSRNVRLSAEQRRAAVCVPHALDAAVAVARGGGGSAAAIAAATEVVAAEPLARLEYVETFDPRTLNPVTDPVAGTRVAIAAWFGDVRLIDNAALALLGGTHGAQRAHPRHESGADDRPRELGLEASPSVPGQLGPQLRVARRHRATGRELGRIVGHEDVLAVGGLEALDGPAGGDDGHPARPGLDHLDDRS